MVFALCRWQIYHMGLDKPWKRKKDYAFCMHFVCFCAKIQQKNADNAKKIDIFVN